MSTSTTAKPAMSEKNKAGKQWSELVNSPPVSAKVLRFSNTDAKGNERVAYKAVFQRRYKDAEGGQWKSTEWFGERDLDALEACIGKVRQTIAEAKAGKE